MTFTEWQEFAQRINAQAKRIKDSMNARGWSIAATVGIPRCCCCLHNASIDKEMTGWSSPGPHVYKTARRARRLIDDWTPMRLAERIIARAWEKIER